MTGPVHFSGDDAVLSRASVTFQIICTIASTSLESTGRCIV